MIISFDNYYIKFYNEHTMTENLENFEVYTDQLVRLNEERSEAAAADFAVANANISNLNVYPVRLRDLSQGFEGLDGDRDAIVGVWRKGVEGEYDDPAAALRSQSRSALIGYGYHAPFSGALEVDDLPDLYDIIHNGVDAIGGNNDAFARFTFKRIRRELFRKTRDIYLGHNYHPMPSQQAIELGKTAMDIVGYPWGYAGRLGLASYCLLGRFEPANKANNPYDEVSVA